MAAARDIPIGHRYGRFVVVGKFKRLPSGEARFPAKCDCGKRFTARFRGSFQGQSCGCLQQDAARSNTKHGGARVGEEEQLYNVWKKLKSRCYDENNDAYHNYGGRGITVCKAWRDSYAKFRSWSEGHGYSPGLELDRRNNNGHYTPNNCRWITHQQNLRNKRTNRLITAFGETKCMAEWSEDPRCIPSLKGLDSRLRRGWSDEQAITAPMQQSKRWHS